MIKNTYEPPVLPIKHEIKLDLNDVLEMLSREGVTPKGYDFAVGFGCDEEHPIIIKWEE